MESVNSSQSLLNEPYFENFNRKPPLADSLPAFGVDDESLVLKSLHRGSFVAALPRKIRTMHKYSYFSPSEASVSEETRRKDSRAKDGDGNLSVPNGKAKTTYKLCGRALCIKTFFVCNTFV